MEGEFELFHDDTPGEQRGVLVKNGQFERLLIQREGDAPGLRLGACSVGRVVAVEAGLSGAFLDIGCGLPHAFLPFEKNHVLNVGEMLEVRVTAEPRESKGAVVRRLGPACGLPRLLQPAPDLLETLYSLAPGVAVTTGAAAIRAVLEAEDEALGEGVDLTSLGLSLAVQRTRALIAVDIDFSPLSGRDARKGRALANREGLVQAARLIRLKRWGGLVVVDLAGVAHDGGAIAALARAAFGASPGIVFGPVSRFGLLQLSLPWQETPIEETLGRRGSERALQTEAIGLTRRLRLAMLSDTVVPRWIARCSPVLAERAAPLVSRLGPRAGLKVDPNTRPGAVVIEEE